MVEDQLEGTKVAADGDTELLCTLRPLVPGCSSSHEDGLLIKELRLHLVA